jgi:hypothetical protein
MPLFKNKNSSSRLLISLPFIVTLSFAPIFVDSLMFVKYLLLVFLSIMIVFSQNIVIDKSIWKIYKSPIIFALLYIFGLLGSCLNTDQSFYESFSGMWGRYNGFFTYLAFVIVFLFSIFGYQKFLPSNLIKGLFYLGLVQCIIGFGEVLKIIKLPFLNKDPYTKLTIGNSNFASIVLVFTIIATLVLIFNTESQVKIPKYLMISSVLLQILLLLTTRAFQGLISLGLSIILLSIYLFSSLKIKINTQTKYFLILISTLVPFFIIAVVKLKIINFNSLYDRFYIWTAAIKIAKDNLIFGVGLDAFGKWFPLYKQKGTLKYEGQFENYDSAHNIYLNFLATGGIMLFVSYLLIQCYVLYRVLLIVRSKSFDINLFAVFCIWIVFQAQSLVSIDHIAVSIWGWMAGGILVGASFEKISYPTKLVNTQSEIKNPRNKKSKHVNLHLGKILAVSLFFYYMYPTVSAEVQIKKSVDFYVYFNKQKSINNLTPNLVEQSRLVNQNLYESTFELRSEDLRNYASMVLFNSGEKEKAFKLTFDTLKKFPRSISARAILGQVYEAQNNPKLASKYFQEIMELDPLNLTFKEKAKYFAAQGN